MTRINVVPPAELCDKHLLAEYRELPRIFSLARLCPDGPKEYVLGAGHMLFFFDKLQFLYDRYLDLVVECERRGFNIAYKEPKVPANVVTQSRLWNNYTPTPEAIALNRARIAERVAAFKRP